MRIGDEQLVYPVIFPGGGCLLASAAALLSAILRKGLALDVSGVRQGYHHVCRGDQIFRAQVKKTVFNLAPTRTKFGLTKLLPNGCPFFTNNDRNPLRPAKNIEQVVDFCHDFFVLSNDFVLLQPG